MLVRKADCTLLTSYLWHRGFEVICCGKAVWMLGVRVLAAEKQGAVLNEHEN